MIACYKGYYEIARMLLEKHADINLKNKKGQNAFLFCFARLEQSLFHNENKQICYMLITLLIEYGIDINMKFEENKGENILIRIVSGQIESPEKLKIMKDILRFLTLKGANPNLKNEDGVNTIDIINSSNAIKEEYRNELLNSILNPSQKLQITRNVGNKNKTHNNNDNKFKKFPSSKNKQVVFEVVDGEQNCCTII